MNAVPSPTDLISRKAVMDAVCEAVADALNNKTPVSVAIIDAINATPRASSATAIDEGQRALIAQMARMTTNEDMDGDMCGDDAVTTISWLIEEARALSPFLQPQEESGQ